LIGLWKRFEETATGKKVKAWVTDLWDDTLFPFWNNKMKPDIVDFWNNTLWPLMKKGGLALGGLIWKGIKTAMGFGRKKEEDDAIQNTTERNNQIDKIMNDTSLSLEAKISKVEALHKEQQQKVKDFDKMQTKIRVQDFMKNWATLLGGMAGGPKGSIAARAAMSVSLQDNPVSRQSGGPVPIMAHEGEYVIQKKAVDKYGMGMMNAINEGQMPSFQNGGHIMLSRGRFFPVTNEAWLGLNDDLRSRVEQLGAIFEAQTGQKLLITDAVRTQKEQEILKEAKRAGLITNLVGENLGKHGTGEAVDISSSQAKLIVKKGWDKQVGLYQRYGSADPVHFEVAGGGTGPSLAAVKMGGISPSIASAGTGFGGGIMGGLFDFASNLFDKVGNLTVGELFGASPTSTMSVAAAEAAATKGITEGFPNTAEISGGGTGSGTVNIVAGSGSSDVANAGMPASPIYDNAFYQLNVGRILALNNSIA